MFIAGFFEMKMKYDESDNTFIRASRAITDKMTDLIGERALSLTVCIILKATTEKNTVVTM